MLKTKQNQSSNFLVVTWCVLFIFCCLTSCKKDDNTPPTISITSPSLNDTVRNELTIKFDAEDNDAVSYVEVYANDSLLGKGNDSFTWNTLGVNDGAYSITCKVYDKNGNYKEDSRNVYVKNALIKVISGFLTATYNILITDSAGDVLAKSSIESNSTLYIKSSKVYDKETYNVFYHNTSNNVSSVIGYLNVKRGFILDLDPAGPYSSNRSVQTHVKSTNTSFSKLQISTDTDYREFTSFADTANMMKLTYSPNHDVFVQAEKNGGLFYKYYVVNENSGIWIDIDEIDTPMAKRDVSLPLNSSYCRTMVLGKPDSNDEQFYYLGLRNGQMLNQNVCELYYPSTGSLQIFKCWMTWNDNIKSNESYYNMYNTGIPDAFEPLRISCDLVNSQLPQFNARFNGDLDYYMLYYYTGNSMIRLSVSNTIQEFNLPDFESIFKDQNLRFSNFNLRQLTVTKVIGYPKEDFLNNYVKSTNPVVLTFDIRQKDFALN